MHSSDTEAVCRGCGKVLRGKPAYAGMPAFDPETGEQCPRNYYGGFVCSEGCDRRAILEQESSFPGAGKAVLMTQGAQSKFNANWRK